MRKAQTADCGPEVRAKINGHFGITAGDLRSLMEAVKTHCGWSEISARLADGDEMYRALRDKLVSP